MRRSFDLPAEVWACFDGLVADSGHKHPALALAEMVMDRAGPHARPLAGVVTVRTEAGFALWRPAVGSAKTIAQTHDVASGRVGEAKG